MKKNLLYVFVFFNIFSIAAQKKIAGKLESIENRHNINLNFHYSFQMPSADLAKMYGNSMAVGGGAEYFNWKTGIIAGAESWYLWGNEVLIDPLRNIRSSEGEVLAEQSFAPISLKQRGFFVGGHIGKLFRLHLSEKYLGGIRVTLGSGFLEHYIRIQDDQNYSAPQVAGYYKNGYDRLTNGLAINGFIGYQMMSFNRRTNFFVGLEWTKGFTKNRRGFNFDTRSVDNETRNDLLFGLRAGWILPILATERADKIEY